jgi:alpha-amylase
MRAWYKQLLHIRRHHPALRRGDFTLLSGAQDKWLAYVRSDAASGDSILVLVNREDSEAAVDLMLPAAWHGKLLLDKLQHAALPPTGDTLQLRLAPASVRIFGIASGKAGR